MKEISEGLGPGIPKQPLMDSCVRAVNLGLGRHANQPKRADGVEMHLWDTRWGRASDKHSYTQTLRTHAALGAVSSWCVQLFRLCILCERVVFRAAGPLCASRCLLKQGEPKQNQTQVTKPGPLISVTALVPSTKAGSIGSSKWMVPHFMALSICHSLSSGWAFSAALRETLFTTTERFTMEASNFGRGVEDIRFLHSFHW